MYLLQKCHLPITSNMNWRKTQFNFRTYFFAYVTNVQNKSNIYKINPRLQSAAKHTSSEVLPSHKAQFKEITRANEAQRKTSRVGKYLVPKQAVFLSNYFQQCAEVDRGWFGWNGKQNNKVGWKFKVAFYVLYFMLKYMRFLQKKAHLINSICFRGLYLKSKKRNHYRITSLSVRLSVSKLFL